MVGIMEPRIKLIEKREKEPLKMVRVITYGSMYIFEADDQRTGKWRFRIQKADDPNVVVITVLERPSGDLYARLEGKSSVYTPAKDGRYLYAPLRIAHFKDGVLTRKFIEKKSDAPEYLRTYKITSYENVKEKVAPQRKAKLVVLVEPDDFERMIRLFIAENAWAALDTKEEFS